MQVGNLTGQTDGVIQSPNGALKRSKKIDQSMKQDIISKDGIQSTLHSIIDFQELMGIINAKIIHKLIGLGIESTLLLATKYKSNISNFFLKIS